MSNKSLKLFLTIKQKDLFKKKEYQKFEVTVLLKNQNINL